MCVCVYGVVCVCVMGCPSPSLCCCLEPRAGQGEGDTSVPSLCSVPCGPPPQDQLPSLGVQVVLEVLCVHIEATLPWGNISTKWASYSCSWIIRIMMLFFKVWVTLYGIVLMPWIWLTTFFAFCFYYFLSRDCSITKPVSLQLVILYWCAHGGHVLLSPSHSTWQHDARGWGHSHGQAPPLSGSSHIKGESRQQLSKQAHTNGSGEERSYDMSRVRAGPLGSHLGTKTWTGEGVSHANIPAIWFLKII